MYFKPHASKQNNRSYVDGAVYHNNPVFVADMERRLIWGEAAGSQADIILSLGTSQNSDIADQALSNSAHFTPPNATSVSAFSRDKSDGVKNQWRKKKLLEKFTSRIKDITDAERIWRDFVSLSESARKARDQAHRLVRINPDIGIEPPALDAKDKVQELQERVKEVLGKNSAQKDTVEKVSRQLVASSFYAEVRHRQGKTPDHAPTSECMFEPKVRMYFLTDLKSLTTMSIYI